jgi:Protein of unknown function (DUF4242)
LIKLKKNETMKKYIIERDVPGAGNMTPEDLQSISKTSNAVIFVLGRPYTWVQSFVTENKIFCIHEAENEQDILEHAKCADIPANHILEIKAVIDPGTASRTS